MQNDHIKALLSPDVLSEDTRAWLRDGFAKHLKDGDSLQKCLKINRTAFLFEKRNKHLRKIISLSDKNKSMNVRCQTALTAINDFMPVYYHHKSSEPDLAWSILETEIFYMLKCGLGFPEISMLFKIMKKFGIS